MGTAFNLVDSFASGVLGILCVGHSPHEAFRELATALDFISRQVSNIKNDRTTRWTCAPSLDLCLVV